ncbi:MAG: carbohydrate ABC transporter permease, partial [Clostridiales bacterium]|nr:carbohydrate ABC transporter permease [Clostridiales bacterium]
MNKNTKTKKILDHVGLLVLSAVMISPVLWWFFATFKATGELAGNHFFPDKWTLE